MDLIKEVETREELYLEIPKGGVGAEIGVCKGSNAVHLFFATKPSVMFLVDTWEDTDDNGEEWRFISDGVEPQRWYRDHRSLMSKLFKEEIEEGRVILHRGVGGDWLYNLPDDTLDWVYLDSDHEYDAICIELDLAVRKVKSGGYIMGHDYLCEPLAWRSSVIRAVNERIQNGDIKMEAITVEKEPSYLTKVFS